AVDSFHLEAADLHRSGGAVDDGAHVGGSDVPIGTHGNLQAGGHCHREARHLIGTPVANVVLVVVHVGFLAGAERISTAAALLLIAVLGLAVGGIDHAGGGVRTGRASASAAAAAVGLPAALADAIHIGVLLVFAQVRSAP